MCQVWRHTACLQDRSAGILAIKNVVRNIQVKEDIITVVNQAIELLAGCSFRLGRRAFKFDSHEVL